MINWVMFCDIPASSEPSRNVPMAKSSNGRRP
jgi:hypothetical protein